MPSAMVNHNRDEPRLAPTISLRAGAQVGCENVAEGAIWGPRLAGTAEKKEVIAASTVGVSIGLAGTVAKLGRGFKSDAQCPVRTRQATETRDYQSRTPSNSRRCQARGIGTTPKAAMLEKDLIESVEPAGHGGGPASETPPR